jgi:glycerate kinase
VRVLVAPQEFKGSLTARAAAEAIAAGVRDAIPGAQIELLPLSDGGPGFLEALQTSIGGELVVVAAHDAIGRPSAASILMGSDGVAYVEAAQANALAHLLPGELAPLEASTFGVGELLRSAIAMGPAQIVVGVGGSASTDGGAGMAQALGARLLDAASRDIAPGGAALAALDRVEWVRPELPDVVVATDVTNPLLGPRGAASVFGPQKGASRTDVARLEAGLARFAEVIERDLGVDVRELPGAGAAGGLAAGLVAFLGARVASGFELVAASCGFAEKLAAADLVITGEGSFDEQSRQGKTTGRVINAAVKAGKPWLVLAGRTSTNAEHAHALGEVAGPSEDPMTQADDWLRRLAAKVVGERPREGG